MTDNVLHECGGTSVSTLTVVMATIFGIVSAKGT